MMMIIKPKRRYKYQWNILPNGQNSFATPLRPDGSGGKARTEQELQDILGVMSVMTKLAEC